MSRILSLLLLALCLSASAQTRVKWRADGYVDGKFRHSIIITGDMNFDRLAFNAPSSYGSPVNPVDTLGTIVPGFYYVASPRIVPGADSVVITFNAPRLLNYSRTPDGVHRVVKGKVEPVIYDRPAITEPFQWTDANGNTQTPKATDLFELNQSLITARRPGPYDVVPSYKKITLTGGESALPLKPAIRLFKSVRSEKTKPEYYRITVADGTVTVEANTKTEARRALASFNQQVLGNQADGKEIKSLPNAVIEDWPDHGYRGLMLDVVRNFQSPAEIEKILRHMRDLRLNVLHFHFADDEGWRLQMPSLPELTEVGSRRGYTLDDVADGFIPQYYRGDGNPDSFNTTSNGYFSRQEFIDMLRLADSYGIAVLPEIESPGHARTAIKAMEWRHRNPRPGVPDLRLIHDGDTSRYTSAQGYHDCVMNPALETTYQFMAAVFDDLIDMYREAGVPLPGIHIGGDEVARGSWDGSDRVRKFMKDNNIANQHEMLAYYVRRIGKILADRGVSMSGWEDIAFVQPDASVISPELFSVNIWNLANDRNKARTAAVAEKGVPVVLTNVDYLYFDQNFNRHPQETGSPWGAYVDDIRTLHAYPSLLSAEGTPVSGMEATLFCETVQGSEHFEQFVFPKIFGLAERAWNADSTYTDAEFTRLMADRMRTLARTRTNFHVRQPGIRTAGGKIEINTPYDYPELARYLSVRFTTDGSEPDEFSPVYTGPIPADGVAQVRARIYLYGRPSLTTILSIE